MWHPVFSGAAAAVVWGEEEWEGECVCVCVCSLNRVLEFVAVATENGRGPEVRALRQQSMMQHPNVSAPAPELNRVPRHASCARLGAMRMGVHCTTSFLTLQEGSSARFVAESGAGILTAASRNGA